MQTYFKIVNPIYVLGWIHLSFSKAWEHRGEAVTWGKMI